jgi:hypothetical protein
MTRSSGYRKEYEALEGEFALVDSLIHARLSATPRLPDIA